MINNNIWVSMYIVRLMYMWYKTLMIWDRLWGYRVIILGNSSV